MGKNNFVLCILLALSVCGCGEKRPLSELRNEKSGLYVEKTFDISIDKVKSRIMDDAFNNGSLLKYQENASGDKITLVRQIDTDGTVMCFFDYQKDNNGIKLNVYNYICSKSFIEETISKTVGY